MPRVPHVLELEQKFAISPTGTVDRLKEIGFEKMKEHSMVDWYFDFPTKQQQTATNYPLIRQDTWLRFRQVDGDGSIQKGQWELKRGEDKDNNKNMGEQKTTVYQEYLGEDALLLVRELLSWDEEGSSELCAAATEKEFDGLEIPRPTIDLPGLIPYARFITHRSTWKPISSSEKTHTTTPFENLTVDLDQTNFGYNVGEVEAVVSIDSSDTNDLVQDAKMQIQKLINALKITSSAEENLEAALAKGKLEYYLQTKRPDVYQILVEIGMVLD